MNNTIFELAPTENSLGEYFAFIGPGNLTFSNCTFKNIWQSNSKKYYISMTQNPACLREDSSSFIFKNNVWEGAQNHNTYGSIIFSVAEPPGAPGKWKVDFSNNQFKNIDLPESFILMDSTVPIANMDFNDNIFENID